VDARLGPKALVTAVRSAGVSTGCRSPRRLATAQSAAATARSGPDYEDEGIHVTGPTQAYVPPGQARVVRAPPTPPGDAAALVLTGDDEPFDNTLWIVPPTREEIRVLHLADEKADEVADLERQT